MPDRHRHVRHGQDHLHQRTIDLANKCLEVQRAAQKANSLIRGRKEDQGALYQSGSRGAISQL